MPSHRHHNPVHCTPPIHYSPHNQLSVEVPVCDFLNHPPPGLGTTLMITHIHIPHHTPHAVFWSDRVAQRYYNSHSFVNMAVSVVMAGRDTGVGVGVHVHAQKHNEEGRDDTTTRTHTTNNYSADTSSACNSQHTRALVSQPSSKHIIDPPAQQQLGGVVQSITVQVGFVGALQTTHHDKDKPTTHPRGWLCQRVSALPTIMQHQPLTRTLLAHALVSVKRYLEDRGADVYTVQVAQGMLLQALGGMVVDVVVDGEEGLGCVGDGAHETAIGDGSDEAAAAIEHGRVCAEDGVLVQHDIPFDAAAEHIPYTTAPHTSHTTAHTPHTTHTPAAQQGSVLDAHPLPPPAPVQSHRTFPDYGHEKPPIHASVQKDRVLLQVCGVCCGRDTLSIHRCINMHTCINTHVYQHTYIHTYTCINTHTQKKTGIRGGAVCGRHPPPSRCPVCCICTVNTSSDTFHC